MNAITDRAELLATISATAAELHPGQQVLDADGATLPPDVEWCLDELERLTEQLVEVANAAAVAVKTHPACGALFALRLALRGLPDYVTARLDTASVDPHPETGTTEAEDEVVRLRTALTKCTKIDSERMQDTGGRGLSQWAEGFNIGLLRAAELARDTLDPNRQARVDAAFGGHLDDDEFYEATGRCGTCGVSPRRCRCDGGPPSARMSSTW